MQAHVGSDVFDAQAGHHQTMAGRRKVDFMLPLVGDSTPPR
jgi:hypothetical protein